MRREATGPPKSWHGRVVHGRWLLSAHFKESEKVRVRVTARKRGREKEEGASPPSQVSALLFQCLFCHLSGAARPFPLPTLHLRASMRTVLFRCLHTKACWIADSFQNL
jgi:hypothetical protein